MQGGERARLPSTEQTVPWEGGSPHVQEAFLLLPENGGDYGQRESIRCRPGDFGGTDLKSAFQKGLRVGGVSHRLVSEQLDPRLI